MAVPGTTSQSWPEEHRRCCSTVQPSQPPPKPGGLWLTTIVLLRTFYGARCVLSFHLAPFSVSLPLNEWAGPFSWTLMAWPHHLPREHMDMHSHASSELGAHGLCYWGRQTWLSRATSANTASSMQNLEVAPHCTTLSSRALSKISRFPLLEKAPPT